MANGSSLGVQNLPVVYNPMQAMTTAMGAEGTSSGGTIVGPSKMMINLLQTIAQGIINLVGMTKEILDIETKEEQLNRLRLRDKRISAGDVAPKPDEAPKAEKKDSMLDTLMKQFKGFGPTAIAIAGVLAMIAAIALLNKYSDQIAALLAPILKFMSETLIPNLQEIHDIIMASPGGYFTALGAVGLITTIVQFFGINGRLSQLFTNAATAIRAAFDPKTLKLGDMFTWKGKINKALFGRITAGPAGAATRAGGLIPTITGFFNSLAATLRTSWVGTKTMNILNGIKSTTTWFTGKLKNIFSVLDDSVKFLGKISGLTRFLKIGLSLTKAIPILGQIVMAITGIFGFITGAIEGYKEDGWSGAIIGGLKGLWDGLFGEFLNLIADILGWIAKKFGMEGLGNFLAKLDFTSEGIWKFFTEWLPGLFGDIKNKAVEAFNNTIASVQQFFSNFDLGEIIVKKVQSLFMVVMNVFNKLKRGFYSGLNATIDKINWALPKWAEIDKIELPAASPDIDVSGEGDFADEKIDWGEYKKAEIPPVSGTAKATGELLAAVTGQKGELATSHMRQSTIVAPVTTTDSSTNVNQTIVYPKSVDPVDNTALQLAKKEYAHFWMSQ